MPVELNQFKEKMYRISIKVVTHISSPNKNYKSMFCIQAYLVSIYPLNHKNKTLASWERTKRNYFEPAHDHKTQIL